jgi:hypothetical protein
MVVEQQKFLSETIQNDYHEMMRVVLIIVVEFLECWMSDESVLQIVD